MTNVKIRDMSNGNIPILAGTELLEIDNLTLNDYYTNTGQLADYTAITRTYSGLNTSTKTLVGAINQVYLWDRTLLGGSVYYVTPHNSGDILKIKSNIYLGTVDPFSRTQFWNYEANSVIRLGSLTSDGDPVNTTSEGSVFYGANAQGDVMSSSDFGYARIKPNRIGLYNGKSFGYTGYLFRLDTITNECYLRDNDGNKTFDFNRLTSAFSFSNTSIFGIAGLFWDGSSALELGDSYFGTSIYSRTDGTVDFTYNPAWSSPNQFALRMNNIANQSSMAGTENGLMFVQNYYDISSPLGVNEGFMGYGTEGNWTSTASTQDSYYINRLAIDGVLNDVHKIYSTKKHEIYNDLDVKSNLSTTSIGYDVINKNIGKIKVDATGSFFTYFDLDIIADTTAYFYIGRNTPQVLRDNSYIYNYLLQRNIRFGSAGGNANMLETWNEATGADLTGTSSSIALYQRQGSIRPFGQLTWTAEGTFQNDPLTQHSGFRAYVLKSGSLVTGLYIDKDQEGTLYGIWSYNFAPSFTAGSNQIPTVKYVNDQLSTSGRLPPYQKVTATSDGQTAFTIVAIDNTKAAWIVINGITYHYTTHFTTATTTLTWLNIDYTIKNGDEIYLYAYV